MTATISVRDVTGRPRFRDRLTSRDLQLMGSPEGRQLLADGYARGGPTNFGVTERGVQGEFYAALDTYMSPEKLSWVRRAGFFFPNANVLTEKHRWLGSPPKPREHFGRRQAQAINNFSFDVTNKDFELTIPFSLHDYRRDQTGQIAEKSDEAAASWEDHWVDRAVTMLEANPTCYDSVALFSASHSSFDSGTQSNLLTNSDISALNVTSTTAPTVAEAAKIMAGVSSYMRGYKDDQGRPANQSASDFLFVVPTAIADAFIQAIAVERESGGGSNTLRALMGRRFYVIDEPRLTSDTVLYCFIIDRPRSGALILQQDEDPVVAFLGANSEYAKLNNEVLYLSDPKRRVAPGQWREVAKCTIS